MARMYSRRRGKAGSKRPAKKVISSWLRYKPKEIQLLIIKLAKEEKTPSQIGLYLRDVYGIPDVMLITKKSITQILEESKLLPEIPEDITALIRRSIALKKHLEKNKHDNTALRGLQLTEAKIKRLTDYYKKSKKLPADWKYESKKAGLMVE